MKRVTAYFESTVSDCSIKLYFFLKTGLLHLFSQHLDSMQHDTGNIVIQMLEI